MKKILTAFAVILCITTSFAQRGGSSSSSSSSSSSRSSFSSSSSSSSFGSRSGSFSSPRSTGSSSGSFGRSSSPSMGSGRSSTSTFNSKGSMTGSSQSTFGGGTSNRRTVTTLPPRKVETPARYSTTFSPERKFKIGTKPTVKHTTTTVVNNRTVYVYPGGGYSYSPMGSIIGYYDAPRVSYVPVPVPSQDYYAPPVSSSVSLGSIIIGLIVFAFLFVIIAFMTR